ncbi:LamG-like jellyroll fold domain-containing protein [Actinoplanes sp. CA-142083]|uniref:LamG-like jellyroll fold domain-containing protein n=1 Tax=Actinoplanes sp. CA-142083 TaxID=3239903 RepID=UPI003D923E0A
MSKNVVAFVLPVVLALSCLEVGSSPAAADPGAAPGARTSAPKQKAGSAAGRGHRTAATATAAKGAAAPKTPPPVPKGIPAVGLEQKLPEPKQPTAAPVPNTLTPAAEQKPPGVVGGSRENSGRRTGRSTVFDNPDGTHTLRFFSGTRYLPDASGEMREADPTLSRGADKRLTPRLAAKSSIAPRADDPVLASVDAGGGAKVGFQLDGAGPAAASVSGATASFAEVRPGADLKLTTLPDGIKEDIVLDGPDSPTSWRFPLMVEGLTPELASPQSGVLFKDQAGAVKAAIAPGFMTDSASVPVVSREVFYTLERDGDGWALKVDIDRAWLRGSARKFPVTVDPSVRLIASGWDTVTTSASNRDYSLDEVLGAGTFAGTQYASYVTFDFWSKLSYKYILGASLNLFNDASLNCNAASSSVYAVRQSWGYGVMAWPGKTYDSASPLATVNQPSKGCTTSSGTIVQPGWHTWQLPRARFTRWAHGEDLPMTGFTIRQAAGTTHRSYYSANTPAPMGLQPYLDVTYSDVGADYSLPSTTFSPPVTATSKGGITVRIKKWGAAAWTPTNGYKLAVIVKNSAGTQLSRTLYPMPATVEYGWNVDVPVEVGPVPVGTGYQLKLTMVDPAGKDFDTTYSVPAGVTTFNVGNGPPILTSKYPAHNGYVDKLRPALWAGYSDPDNFPAGAVGKYSFRICNGTPAAPTGCQSSGWITNAAWQVPAGVLAWSKQSFWYVTLNDTQNTSPEYGPFSFTPIVAQPEITSHLAGAPDDADAPGLNPQVGNYETTTTDAAVPAVGPALSIERTYNSQDPRTDGAFGPGWASPLDQRLVVDGDGSGNVVVTLSTGRTVRFGLSGSAYQPPPGMNLTLVRVAGPPVSWILRDPSGSKRTFDAAGRLVTVEDASGRKQTFTYDGTSTRPSRIRDEASGRSLWATWVGSRLTAVATDPPAAGAAAPTWTYTYDGAKLSKVCSPLSATSCTSYTYVTSSHYRSVVLDDNPAGYWPLSGSAANLENVVARSPDENKATARNVTSGRPGALSGSPDGSLGFTGATDSYVALPDNLLGSGVAFSIELWFKAAAGKSGVLFGSQSVPAPAVPPSGWNPNLDIGTDGKLRGLVYTGASSDSMVSPGVVNDGLWHHAVLTVAVDTQTLYLDGNQIGQITGKALKHFDMSRHHVGNGYTKNWPLASTGYFPFTGDIDEVAFYRHPLALSQVKAHYAAQAASTRLATVVEPGPFTATTAGYDHASGRITTMTDRNGATWTLDPPTVGDRVRVVTLSSSARDAITYTYDADHNGRIIARTDNFGTGDWEYNEAGFVYNYTDPNDHTRFFFTDDRGNRTADIVWYNGDFRYRYYGYALYADPLDPRNDQLLWASDGRDRDAYSDEHRTWYYRDDKGRPTGVISPKLPGQLDWTARHDYFYTDGTQAAIGGGTAPPGLVRVASNMAGGWTWYYYNSVGDLVKTVDPAGLTTEVTFDAIGRPTASKVTGSADGTTADYGTTTTTYNAASLPDTVTSPGVVNPITGVTHTARTKYTYDASGRTKQVDTSDTTGGDATRTWKTGYDPAGRITSSTTPDNAVTSTDWDAAGNRIRETRPGGQVLEYKYDDDGRLVETAGVGAGVDPMDPAATRMVVESRAYDPAGQLATVVDAMGRETAYTYFETGLVESVKHVTRNANGTVASTLTQQQNEYDYAGNLVRRTEAGGVVRDFMYDNGGNLIQEVLDPAGLMRSTSYQMRGDGQPSSIVSGNGLAVDVDTPGEKAILTDGGSLIDGTRARYADGATSFTYKFTLPSDTTGASLITDIANQFLVETSPNNSTWTKVLEETRDIRDGSNRAVRTIDLTPALAGGKTIYLRVRDSQPATGWGGRVKRSELRFQRAGAPAESASFSYDAMGRGTTTTVTDPAANPQALVTTIKRDPRGLQTSFTDPAGAVTTYAYDKSGELERTVEPARPVWRDGVATDNLAPASVVGRNTFGEATDTRDANGAVIRVARDAVGRGTQTTLPAYTPPGGVTIVPVEATEYDERGLPKKETDALGRVTGYEYDKNGWLTKVTEPDPDGAGPKTTPVTQYKRNRLGEVLETVDPLGARRLATYDDRGNQITDTVTERSGDTTYYYTTTMAPDARGRTTAVTSPRNDTTTTVYDTADQRVKVTDADGVATEFRYNATGRPIAEIVGGALATGYTYDSLGRTTAVTGHTVSGGVLSAALRTSRTSYDRDSRVSRETTAEGRITDYTYDASDQVRTVTQRRVTADAATTITVRADYDAVGNRTRTTDGNNNVTETRYNDWAAPVEVLEPATAAHPAAADRTWTTAYDKAGQAVRMGLPGGVTVDRTYDGLGRITTETGSGAEGSTAGRSFDYDANGKLLKAGTPGGENTYTWSDRGLLTRVTGPGGAQAAFGYDSDQRMTTRSDLAGATTFTYTGADRLKTVTDPLVSKTLTYAYRTTGEVQSVSQGTGAASRSYGYDNLGRLASDTLTAANGTQSAKVTYAYDNDDLLIGTTATGITGDGANGYGYDGAGRQTSWIRPDGSTVTYGYDNASNRTSVAVGASTRASAFDERNRLLTATGGSEPDVANTWSPRGTIRSTAEGGSTTDYTFDAFEQMVTAANPGYTVNFAYDSLGRVATRNGVAFGYSDLGNAPVVVPGGKVFRDPESRPLSATLDGGAGRSLFQDARHGDLRGSYDPADGALSRSAVYDPSGQVVASSAERLPLGFQGGWSDPQTGLLNAHARWYDPAAAGFTSRDTWTLEPDPVAQANQYGYGNASPLNNVDADGHNPLVLLGGVFLGSNPVGWGILGVVAVVGTGVLIYQGYQWNENRQWADSASSWDGPATATQTNPYAASQDAYAARLNAAAQAQAAAARAQAYANYQQAATQARINARVAQMTAAYNQYLAARLEAARAQRIALEKARTEAQLNMLDQRAADRAAAIRAAKPGAVGANVVKPPAAVALVGGAGLVTNIGGTVQLPGTVFAGSDGSDAANTAAAAGAVAATEGLKITGTKDPNGCGDDPKDIIQEIAQGVADEGLDSIDADITDAQRALYDEEGWRIWRDRGHIVHNRTNERLQDAYPDRFKYNRRGVDFFDTLTKKWIELTTPGAVSSHKAKGKDPTKSNYDPKYLTCDYSTYKFKP